MSNSTTLKNFWSQARAWLRKWGPADLSPGEVADMLEAFLDGTGNGWEWDDLTTVSIRNPALNEFVRENIDVVPTRFPPTKRGQLTSAEGEQRLRQIIVKLREMERARSAEQAGDRDEPGGRDRDGPR